ncbi:LysR family transcriptional regulator [Nonomuraea sp. NPDC050783]|uniref:LysR family transcriptional regulator n=1 Tax=Nonomuraea sp. NPDC050783 TaxID=3154634 RepID=UPI003466A2B4
MDDLNLRQLRYFVAVAEDLHVGRAAARLHISQPSLSQHLRRLQQRLGVALVQREGRGIALTPAGAAILPSAQRVLAAATETEAVARQMAHHLRGHLRIGFLAGGALELTSLILRAFTARCPDATFTLTEFDFTDPSAGLSTGTTDVGLVRLPFRTEDLEVVPLFTEPRVAVVHRDHPLAGHRELSVAQILDQPWCCVPVEDDVWRDFWRATAHRHGQAPRLTPPVRTFEEMFESVGAGLGIAVVSASAARLYPRDHLRYVEVPDLEPTVAAAAAGKRDTSPLTAAFLDAVREVVESPTLHANARQERPLRREISG